MFDRTERCSGSLRDAGQAGPAEVQSYGVFSESFTKALRLPMSRCPAQCTTVGPRLQTGCM